MLSTALYYHVLEGIVNQEKKRLKNPGATLSVRFVMLNALIYLHD